MTVQSRARDALRDATRDIHERLHRHGPFQRLLDGTISRRDYHVLLQRLYGFHQPFETALTAQSDRWPELELGARCRVHLLASDLKSLGSSQHQIAALPLCAAPQFLDDPGRLAGCLYVKEGATLGGRVLARKLDVLLTPGLDGRRFFTGSTQDGALWRNFCAAIETPAFSGSTGGMVVAACETFELFEQWISGQHSSAQSR